ncbi:uncharacterized protein LOC117330701 [Pecten maximus]|uniref:uncharacterized protein LOC117330701 n=1 Tax=Pecten maximus TaxID=6579 RepID=UPI0014581066|nr:uncharacterized protein LOC117330701 [Pecten maximus]
MEGNPWQPHHVQYQQPPPAHEEERLCNSREGTAVFGQAEGSQTEGLALRDPCLIRDDCDEQVETDNRSRQTQLPQMQNHLAGNEQQQLTVTEQNGLVPRNQRHVDLDQIVRSESFVDCPQTQEPPAPHVPVRPEVSTSFPVVSHAPHSSENRQNGHSLCNPQDSNTGRGRTRIDMALLTAPPPGQEEEETEAVDEFIVPILPIPMAIACCLMNFAAPGLGTIVAGMCMPCCGDAEEMSRRRKLCSGAAVVGVGFLQLLLTACFLVGWIWSAIWGLSLVGTSLDYYEKPQEVSSWRNRVSSARAQSDSTCGCFSRPLGSGRRRPRSNFIYPMRAPSDIDRDSPPPPYVMFATPPPSYSPPSPAVGANSNAGQLPTQDLPENNETPNLSSANRCAVCQKDFVTEEHRFSCRRCTDIVCGHCYTKRIPFQGGDCSIVCDVCYNEHLEMEAEMNDHI